MTLFEIASYPTCSELPNSHESMTRGYHILALVKDYLRRGVPADVISEIVEELEQATGFSAIERLHQAEARIADCADLRELCRQQQETINQQQRVIAQLTAQREVQSLDLSRLHDEMVSLGNINSQLFLKKEELYAELAKIKAEGK